MMLESTLMAVKGNTDMDGECGFFGNLLVFDGRMTTSLEVKFQCMATRRLHYLALIQMTK